MYMRSPPDVFGYMYSVTHPAVVERCTSDILQALYGFNELYNNVTSCLCKNSFSLSPFVGRHLLMFC